MGDLERRQPEQRYYQVTVVRRMQTHQETVEIVASVECWAFDMYDALGTVQHHLAHAATEPRFGQPPVMHRVSRTVTLKGAVITEG